MNKPIIILNPVRGIICVNTACFKCLPDMEYALFLILPADKKIALLPCGNNERDSVRLRSSGSNRSKARYIRCPKFLQKITEFLKLSADYRYKICGNFASFNTQVIIIFDLAENTEI